MQSEKKERKKHQNPKRNIYHYCLTNQKLNVLCFSQDLVEIRATLNFFFFVTKPPIHRQCEYENALRFNIMPRKRERAKSKRVVSDCCNVGKKVSDYKFYLGLFLLFWLSCFPLPLPPPPLGFVFAENIYFNKNDSIIHNQTLN